MTASHAPLVLAGVDYLFPIYREANTYPHLLDKGITGSPEELTIKDLHRQSLSLVEDRIAALPPGHADEARLLRMRETFRILIRAKQQEA